MSYARSRLWLGISGVGFIVMLSVSCLAMKTPYVLLPSGVTWSWSDLVALVAGFTGLVAIMLPFDVVGGYLLPSRAGRSEGSVKSFLLNWGQGVTVQAGFFVTSGLLILALGRCYGLLGASLAVGVLCLVLVTFQFRLGVLAGTLQQRKEVSEADRVRLRAAARLTSACGWQRREIVLVSHSDMGFMGGIVGLPRREKIVVPEGMLSRLSTDELAATIARRLEAIDTGSRTRGLAVAVGWVLLGFNLSAMSPGAGVTSVAELTMTCLGFTLWSFLGLLTLPTLSRQAAFAIDNQVVARGVPSASLTRSLCIIDQQQDDEQERPRIIETIFHPVPSVGRRHDRGKASTPIAWHVARTALFLSWACMGLLVRAVHCNVGRPELWVMYPTD